MNLLIQYSLVALFVIAALAYMLNSIRRRCRHKGGSCCDCALADKCKSPERKDKEQNDTKRNDR